MPQAVITVGGTPGSDDDVPINTLVQLGNDGLGDENLYAWVITAQPAGPLDNLNNSTIPNPTFVPKKEGTYRVTLLVDGLYFDEVIVAVRDLKTRERIPAPGEETEASGTRGWDPAIASLLQTLLDFKADSGTFVARTGEAGLLPGNVLRVSAQAEIKSTLPGEENVPVVVKASASATSPAATSSLLAVLVSGVDGGQSPGNNELVVVRIIGQIDGLAGSPSVGDAVYVSATGTLTTTIGPIPRVVARVIAVSGGSYNIFFNGLNQDVPIVNVQWFGAVPDSDLVNAGTDNKTAFNLATSAAIATKRPLYLPGGNYLLKTGGAAGAWVIAGSVRIVGDGISATKIKLGANSATPNVPVDTFPTSVTITDGAAVVEFDDIAFYGMNGTDSQMGDEADLSQTMLFSEAGSGVMRFRNCYMSDGHVQARRNGGGEGLHEYINCKFTRARNSAIFAPDHASENTYLNLQNCELDTLGLPGGGGGGLEADQINGYPIYMNSGVSHNINNCRFIDFSPGVGSGGAIHISNFAGSSLAAWLPNTAYTVGDKRTNANRSYECITSGTSAGSGGPTTTAADITDGTVHWKYIFDGPSPAPRWCNITNCLFTSTKPGLHILTNVRKNTFVANCFFDTTSGSSSIRVRAAGAKFTNCRWFGHPGAQVAVQPDLDSKAHIEIIGGVFDGDWDISPLRFAEIVPPNTPPTRAEPIHCIGTTFKTTSGVHVLTHTVGLTTDCHLILDNCQILGTHNTEWLFMFSGTITIRNCYVRPINSFFRADDSDINIILHGNTWGGGVGIVTYPLIGGSFKINLFGEENNWLGGGPQIGTAAADIRGSVKLRRAPGDNVASGATIVLANEADTFHVTGTVTINTITFNGTNAHRAIGGPLTLIADGAFKLSNTGNITPRHTSARTVGEAITLVRDPVADKWIEIGPAEIPINVQWFGAVADSDLVNGGTDNYAAFNSALTAAKNAKRNLYVPTGDYLIKTDGGQFLNIDSTITILGDGERLSRIKLGANTATPDVMNGIWTSVQISGASTDFEMQGVTLHGCDQNTASLTDLQCLIERIGNAGTTLFKFKDCRFRAGYRSIKHNGGDGALVEILNCDIRAYGSGALLTDSNGDSAIRVVDCTLEVDGAHADSNDYPLYINTGNHILIRGCRFIDTSPKTGSVGGYHLHIFGTAGGSPDPKYCIIDSCQFLGTVAQASILTHSTRVTQISNCYFDSNSPATETGNHIKLRAGGAVITNCIFKGGGNTGAALEPDSTSTELDLVVQGCRFEGAYSLGTIRRFTSNKNKPWVFRDCVFRETGGERSIVAATSSCTDHRTVLENCLFAGSVHNARIDSGRTELRNCVVQNGGLFTFSAEQGNVEIVMDSCTALTATNILQLLTPVAFTIEIWGSDNDWKTGAPIGVSSELTGHLQPRHSKGPDLAIASNAITISPSHSVQAIGSGTGPINTIDMANDAEYLFGGPFYFIMGVAVAFTASDNIAPAHANVRTVGEMVGFIRNPTTNKWVEISGSLSQTTTAPSAIDPDDSGSAGTSTEPAHADHQHTITTNAPITIGLAVSNAEGNGSGFARDNHDHRFAGVNADGLSPAHEIRVSFAAGAGGSPDDVTIYNANAPWPFRILDSHAQISGAVGGQTVTVRSATGGGGSALSDAFDAASTGVKRNVNQTATPTVATNGTVVVRRSDSAIAGEVVMRIQRTD